MISCGAGRVTAGVVMPGELEGMDAVGRQSGEEVLGERARSAEGMTRDLWRDDVGCIVGEGVSERSTLEVGCGVSGLSVPVKGFCTGW